MENFGDYIGILIVLFLFFFPILRGWLAARAEKRKKREKRAASRVSREEAFEEKPPPIPKRPFKLPPRPIVHLVEETPPPRRRKKRRPSFESWIIHQQILNKPKAFDDDLPG